MDNGAQSGLGSGRTRGREVRAEVLTGTERRRRWSTEEKLRILAQAVAPNASASLTCRMHGISSGQFYTWRKQFRTGEPTGFVPVSVAPDRPVTVLPASERLEGGRKRTLGQQRRHIPLKLTLRSDVDGLTRLQERWK